MWSGWGDRGNLANTINAIYQSAMKIINKSKFTTILVLVLFAISTILLMVGFSDLYNLDQVTENVDLSKLYIDLGYNSIGEWLADYKYKIFLMLTIGLFCIMFAIYLLIRGHMNER